MKAVFFVIAFLIIFGCLGVSSSDSGGGRGNNLRIRYTSSGQIYFGNSQGIILYNKIFEGIWLETKELRNPDCYNLDDFVLLPQNNVLSAYRRGGEGCGVPGVYLTFLNNNSTNIILPPTNTQSQYENPVLTISNDSKFLTLTYENYSKRQEKYLGGFYLISTNNLSVISNIQTSSYPKTHFSPDGKYLGVLTPFTAISIYSIPSEILKNNFSTVSAEDFWWLNDTDMLLLENSKIVSINPLNQSGPGKLLYDVNCNQLVGYYCSLNQIEVSPNGRYVAVGGSYAVNEDTCNAGPEGFYICSEGFIAVVDLYENGTVFWNQGGQAHDNSAVFDWSPDGNELAYTFDGGSIFKQKISG